MPELQNVFTDIANPENKNLHFLRNDTTIRNSQVHVIESKNEILSPIKNITTNEIQNSPINDQQSMVNDIKHMRLKMPELPTLEENANKKECKK
jgi:hypothetical protein